MSLHKFLTVVFICVSVFNGLAQYKVSGTITSDSKKTLNNVKIFDGNGGEIASSNTKGVYSFSTAKRNIELIFYVDNYQFVEKKILLKEGNNILNIKMNAFSENLSEVVVKSQRRKAFELGRLKDVEQTAIYAGKKTEVVLVNQSTVNLASNNARQIYSQVVGLNIFENDDAGLQLNIGGRGLDPNRTSNFNTRQNGYDISADVLGYPESYYSPPAEAIEEIQIVRGAASLQYGTQFGGLVNFVLKKPNPNKQLEIVTRNTIGSNNLFTNFTSVSGTSEKLSYLAYYNYKRGDGFRPNSEFESKNAFFHVGYDFNSDTKVEVELTYLHYLAQQAGGLTDDMFNENPLQSNRTRNWFEVDWLLYNFKLSHAFSDKTNFTFNFFGLNASRKALGFRTNRVSQVDDLGGRDLITGDFNNFGFEARLLSKYKIFNKDATFLIGTKFYKADNTSVQGPGTDGSDANFSAALDQFPNYRNQSDYNNPNLNIAVFGENIFYINDKISITPGFRVEYIKTESDGFLKRINFDGAGNVIFNETIISSDDNIRSFVLLGLGASYKPSSKFELYGNISQNYRSVTFSDVNIVNPSFQIASDLGDEKGFTADLGIRGNINRTISYDAGIFGLFYNDRIGLIQKELEDGSGRVVQERRNAGDARILGIESLVDFNLKRLFNISNDFDFNYFVNTSFIQSEYIRSEVPGVINNQVEFIPDLNIKTGFRFGYKNFSSNIQYTYLSEQFTDASNSVGAGLSGVNGVIPSYDVLDFSTSYKYKYFKLEAGVNNVLNNSYFTRRATGYPGPGIIPSAPRTYYVTLEFKL
ncbi:Fe(3+) dicitrate transport protein [Tenacibaculum sp. MAR_2009_124]|uniref:TonB-dependent receptor family protein n=1 Tax=Tenacibaculum sp. MAR_2009_124 TaxID=1250059 RepID=UPI0008945FEB|nr:TonB-dependent receptor [Tenacibaculum sp. MAR_2009_124]SEB50158.1 Fe(3+) dicitrate transport protein [Tenacibaculum sp. MAR_2009_124]